MAYGQTREEVLVKTKALAGVVWLLFFGSVGQSNGRVKRV
jgi:hypothetical protein